MLQINELTMNIYVIKGDPVPLARPRFRNSTVYDKQKEIKLIAGIHLRAQHNERPLLEGALHLDATFFMKMPLKARPQKMDTRPHIARPDLDNLIKYILDVCNKVVLRDDCCVCSITARKMYSTQPRSEFSFTPIFEMENTLFQLPSTA